jgi:hypothetical protein
VLQELSVDEIKDLNRGRSYLAEVASRYDCTVYQSIDAGVREVLRRLGKLNGCDSPDEFFPP